MINEPRCAKRQWQTLNKCREIKNKSQLYSVFTLWFFKPAENLPTVENIPALQVILARGIGRIYQFDNVGMNRH